ncbi:MAG TPA: DUF4367 domain-containing protein [Oscillospiraceae bacterium]|nr:DUF4367 domain-containing protein [Oscillospiraceae bacterium]HPF55006.1 DUF4367 domain-containing protein [Clostridiales bacterium]HPK35926.1 DUF4367 domain-containing protein [Oscillospiraceae bacterium]HPR75620.1 DUF4367 domain-containing protein [Oscillospiraceae bacterium]
MDGIKFDEALKDILVDSVLDEYANVIAKNEISFSRQYLKRKKRMLRNPERFLKKKSPPYHVKIIRAIVAATLIVLMALAAGAALIPYKRNYKMERYPAYIQIEILQDRDCTVNIEYGDFYPKYLPAGFYENTDRRSKVSNFINYQFLGPDETVISLRVQGLTGGSVMCFENEHGVFSEGKLNHRAAIIKSSLKNGCPNEIIWFSKDGTIMFDLCSTINLGELEKIAKTIH